MPVKGRNPTITMKEVAVFAIVMMGFVAGMLVLFGVNLGDLRWEIPEDKPDYTIIFTGPTGTNASFDDGAISYQQLDNESSALIRIKFMVYCYSSNGSWFELGEYDEAQEVWSGIRMQESENRTFTTEVQIEMLESRTFAIWYCEVGRKTHGITLKFILESYKGTVRVCPFY